MREGAAVVHVPAGVFFNPKGTLQRDLSVAAVHAYWLSLAAARPLHILDAMSGSGVRALRYLLELPSESVATVVANDLGDVAAHAIKESARLSGLETTPTLSAPSPRGLRLKSSRRKAGGRSVASAMGSEMPPLPPHEHQQAHSFSRTNARGRLLAVRRSAEELMHSVAMASVGGLGAAGRSRL